MRVAVTSPFFHLLPYLKEGKQVHFIVVDCLRLDHWLAIESLLQPYFYTDLNFYYSILPSATLYSRNALFSGLFPSELASRFPDYWQEGVDDETSTNRYERQLLQRKIQDEGLQLKPKLRYFKIFCLLYTSPSPRDLSTSRMPSSA